MSSKRILSLALALMLVLSMVTGCGAPAVVEKPVVEKPATEAPVTTPEEPVVAVDEKEVILAATSGYLSTLPEKFNAMSAKDALQLLADNPAQVMLVDLKSKEDYDAGHIAGAVNIPFAELGKNLDRLPKNKQIILQCYSGQTSSEAVSLTRLLGLNTFNFQGGFNFGWKPLELGEDTLETTENPLPEASAPTLNEEEQIIWDAVAKFFNDGKSYIEKPEDVNELVTSNPGAVYVLDIRSAEDYAKGHIETAEHIAFKEVGDNFDKLPKNKPIYVVCYTGQTAAQVLPMLRLAGFNAFSISRGMTGWDGAELPVVQ